MLFITINLTLLVWSTGYLNFLEEKSAIQDDIIVIEPDNQFKKNLAPKDQSFPNEKSKVWRAFEDKPNQEEIFQNNQKAENNFENKSNKIENNKETESVKLNKENKLIDDGKVEIKTSENNQMLEEKKLKSDFKTSNDQITNKSKNNYNLEENNTNKELIFYVQVASLSKKDLVEKEWNRFKKKNSKYMTNLTYISQKAQLKDNRVFFRLLVGKFKSKQEANIFCGNLSISNCIIKKINE